MAALRLKIGRCLYAGVEDVPALIFQVSRASKRHSVWLPKVLLSETIEKVTPVLCLDKANVLLFRAQGSTVHRFDNVRGCHDKTAIITKPLSTKKSSCKH